MQTITADQLPANDGPERFDHANGCCCDACVDLCPHGFPPADGCFACMGVDMFAWVTPEVIRVVEHERRTGDLPIA